MGFSRQEYWSGLHTLLQGIFPIQGLNPHLLCLLHWQANSLPLVPPGKPLLSHSKHQFMKFWKWEKMQSLLLESQNILVLISCHWLGQATIQGPPSWTVLEDGRTTGFQIRSGSAWGRESIARAAHLCKYWIRKGRGNREVVNYARAFRRTKGRERTQSRLRWEERQISLKSKEQVKWDKVISR